MIRIVVPWKAEAPGDLVFLTSAEGALAGKRIWPRHVEAYA